jgi:elongation factor Ts
LHISTEVIKELREKSGAGVIDCKNALLESSGDLEKANEILTKRGVAIAKKKADRVAEQGVVESYIHPGGKIGVLVEINCETDFVAHTDDFKELAHNIAMQIAAMSPKYLSPDEIPADEAKTEDHQTLCLHLQPFIKDPSKTVQDIVTETIAKVGENIKVRRFVRFELGF